MLHPEDVVEAKRKSLDPVVEQATDELIAKHWNGSGSKFTAKELVEQILNLKFPLPHINGNTERKKFRDKLYEDNMLDIEDIYRENGWEVFFDRPGYNENYHATYNFERTETPHKKDKSLQKVLKEIKDQLTKVEDKLEQLEHRIDDVNQKTKHIPGQYDY